MGELIVPIPEIRHDGCAEEEQELQVSPIVEARWDEKCGSPSNEPFREHSTPFNARKTKRVQHKTLPKNFRASVSNIKKEKPKEVKKETKKEPKETKKPKN